MIVISPKPDVVQENLKDDGVFPNNENLPLIVYRSALDLPARDSASAIETLFTRNRWQGTWRNGIYSFHHYHSTAHEVLGIYRGQARVQFGGENGVRLTVNRGDVVIIPAGVAHKNLGADSNFRVVGGYPSGQTWDMCYGKPDERPRADRNIASVALPDMDPVYGGNGPLCASWDTLND